MSSESHGPPEVRSEEFPLGFPWLQGVLRDCVASANSIYIHMALFFFVVAFWVGCWTALPSSFYFIHKL